MIGLFSNLSAYVYKVSTNSWKCIIYQVHNILNPENVELRSARYFKLIAVVWDKLFIYVYFEINCYVILLSFDSVTENTKVSKIIWVPIAKQQPKHLFERPFSGQRPSRGQSLPWLTALLDIKGAVNNFNLESIYDSEISDPLTIWVTTRKYGHSRIGQKKQNISESLWSKWKLSPRRYCNLKYMTN